MPEDHGTRVSRARHGAADREALARSKHLTRTTSGPMKIPSRSALQALLALLAAHTPLASQVIDLTVNDVGLAIGNKPSMTGLRINFRDRDLRKVNGVNITLWTPYEPATGTVNGLALGVPATGAGSIKGIGVGVIGLGAER